MIKQTSKMIKRVWIFCKFEHKYCDISTNISQKESEGYYKMYIFTWHSCV